MRTPIDVGGSAPQLAGATQRNNTEAINTGRDAGNLVLQSLPTNRTKARLVPI
jgi:hypothetical protein